jgi:hypothetical protein
MAISPKPISIPPRINFRNLETWTALQSAYIECFSYDLRFEYQTSKVIPSVLRGCTQ